MINTVKPISVMEALKTEIGEQAIVLGCAASGKSWFADKLAEVNPGHRLWKSDDFMHYGYKESVYKLIDAIDTEKSFIVEGVQCARLLRKSLELNLFYPTVVFEILRPVEQIRKVYFDQRLRSKFNGAMTQEKASQTIIDKYLNMENSKPPIWVRVDNSDN